MSCLLGKSRILCWLVGKATYRAWWQFDSVTVIQDTIPEIAAAINEAAARKPQFIITTGGLGPTFNDKTLQGITVVLNSKLKVNPEAMAFVKKRCIEYSKKHDYSTNIEWTPPRVKMATLPEKAIAVDNPIGTAPAVRANVKETILVAFIVSFMSWKPFLMSQ